MAHRLIFDPSIPDDLGRAIDYYEPLSPVLSGRFRDQVNCRLDDISKHPESFPIDVSPIRFAKIEKFPYIVFFVVNTDFISILAIVHGSSDPSKWRNRRER